MSNRYHSLPKVVICLQMLKSHYCEHCYFMAFNTRKLWLLQGLMKIVSVPQDDFIQDKTKEELKSVHLTSHSLNPCLHFSVRCCMHQVYWPETLHELSTLLGTRCAH